MQTSGRLSGLDTFQHQQESRGHQFELQILWVAVLGHIGSVTLQEASGPWQLQRSVTSGPPGCAGALPPGCRVCRVGPVLAQKPPPAAEIEQACVGAAREGGRSPGASPVSFTWGVFL